MTKYIIKRILIAIPVLLGITVIDYAIMCMAGSPLEMLQGPRVSEAAVQAKAIALGLDKPFYVQYFVWLGQLLHGNMGYSIKNYQPVAAMITSHLGPTLLLMGVSLLVSILLAVPAGIYSAIHQYSKGDYTVVTLSFLGSSIPGFFLAMLLIYLFTVKLGWLPSGGMTTLGTSGCLQFPWQEPISDISAAQCLKFYSRIICAQRRQRELVISWSSINMRCVTL